MTNTATVPITEAANPRTVHIGITSVMVLTGVSAEQTNRLLEQGAGVSSQ